MSESQLKKLKAEKDRLEVEAEAVKELVAVSIACQEYVLWFLGSLKTFRPFFTVFSHIDIFRAHSWS